MVASGGSATRGKPGGKPALAAATSQERAAMAAVSAGREVACSYVVLCSGYCYCCIGIDWYGSQRE